MARLASRVFLHALGAGTMVYGYKSLSRLTGFDGWIRAQYGGHSQFLTLNGLLLALSVMASGLLIDIISLSGVESSLAALLHALVGLKRLLLLLALPIAVVVAGVYWPILALRPELMLAQLPTDDPTLDAPVYFRIPLDIDLALHGFPGPFLLLDFFLFEPKFSAKTMSTASIIAASVATSYAAWIEHCATHNGFFPYPFLTVSPLPVRIVIYAVCTAFAVASSRLMNSLHP